MLAERKTNIERNIQFIKNVLKIVLIFSVFFEMIFFFSLPNLAGCLMTVAVWYIFDRFVFKAEYVADHLFPFVVFSNLFVYRFLPLTATLLEGKPITFGFEAPYRTFFYETLLFVIASVAFLLVFKGKPLKNNFIQNTFLKLGFFNVDDTMIWCMGIVGIISQLYLFLVVGDIEYGDVINKTISGLVYLKLAPALLLFPQLNPNIRKNRNRIVIIVYLLICSSIGLFSGKRSPILSPFAITFYMLIIFFVTGHKSLGRFFTPVKLITLGLILIIVIPLISDISLAMLYNRRIRNEVTKKEFFNLTIETLQDKILMQKIRSAEKEMNDDAISYIEDWDETYLNNFILNRYANLRISDQTIYYADKIGYANHNMYETFINTILATLPTPALNFLYIKIDKNEMDYSPGDMLYYLGSGNKLSFGGHRVTSHIGDGLATFGFLYFPFQFIIFLAIFKLLDCLVFFTPDGTIYSPFGFLQLIMLFNLFNNAAGIVGNISYLLRGFFQTILIFFVVISLIRFLFLKKDNIRYV